VIRVIPIQEAYKTKIDRQERLEGLKFKCHGSCAYVGDDISPGCYGCFYSDAYYCGFMLGRDFNLPDVCNRNCVYCFEPHEVKTRPVVPEGWHLAEEWKEAIVNSARQKGQAMLADGNMQYYEFSGICEPLLYLPVLVELMNFLRGVIDPLMKTRGWAKIYTNGTLLNLDKILKLRDLGFDEVRVHPGAADFSSEVYDNMRLAVKYIPTVTAETPSWPPHRDNLFKMLPIIEDIGIKHLNICQVEVASKRQLQRMEKALGEIKLYQAFYPVVDDGGLVEDIIKEVLAKGYSYSVIDCNGFVKQSRSALTENSYWNLLNCRYPPEWARHRYDRRMV
jgi:pyruvate formate-lyase activating enzyme-like uncharacterized protein